MRPKLPTPVTGEQTPVPPVPKLILRKTAAKHNTLLHTQIILVLSKWHLDVAPSFFVFFSLILVIQEGCRDKALSRGRWLGKDDRESPLTFFNKSSERAKNSICSCAKLASGAGDTADLYFWNTWDLCFSVPINSLSQWNEKPGKYHCKNCETWVQQWKLEPG